MRARVFACLLVAVSGSLLGACGSSSTTSTAKKSTAASPAAIAVAEISQNWGRFFSPSTSVSTKIALLQNGSQFAPAINALAKSPFAKEASAKVTSVKLTSATTATVTYTVTLAGVAALKNAKGSAVKIGSTWEVADASVCQLLKLEGSPPRACSKG